MQLIFTRLSSRVRRARHCNTIRQMSQLKHMTIHSSLQPKILLLLKVTFLYCHREFLGITLSYTPFTHILAPITVFNFKNAKCYTFQPSNERRTLSDLQNV